MTRRTTELGIQGPVRSHQAACRRTITVALAAAVTAGLVPSPRSALADAGVQGQIAAPGLTTLLHEIGFTPELLASANGRAGVVSSLRSAALARGQLLEAATQATQVKAGAKSALEGLRGRVLTAGATSGSASAITQAEQNAVQAEVAEASASAALREALLADLESSWPTLDGAFIRGAWANPAPSGLPVEYRALSLSPDQWAVLASACEAVAAATTASRVAQFTADQQAIFSWANGQPSVIAARQRLAAYKPELELAFAQAMYAEATQGQ